MLDTLDVEADATGPFALVDLQGELLAVYERADAIAKPSVVLASAGSPWRSTSWSRQRQSIIFPFRNRRMPLTPFPRILTKPE